MIQHCPFQECLNPLLFQIIVFIPIVQGAGVGIYIVDTGTQTSHNVFGGRAQKLYGGNDDHGHGTHCGGTAGGNIYGIARQATIYSVKVCNQWGQCPTSTLLDGRLPPNIVSSHNTEYITTRPKDSSSFNKCCMDDVANDITLVYKRAKKSN